MREISEDEDLGKFSFSSFHFLYPFRGQLMKKKTSKDSKINGLRFKLMLNLIPFLCSFHIKMVKLRRTGVNGIKNKRYLGERVNPQKLPNLFPVLHTKKKLFL